MGLRDEMDRLSGETVERRAWRDGSPDLTRRGRRTLPAPRLDERDDVDPWEDVEGVPCPYCGTRIGMDESCCGVCGEEVP